MHTSHNHTQHKTRPHRAGMTTSHIAQTPHQTLPTTPHKLGPERLNLTQPGNQTQALGRQTAHPPSAAEPNTTMHAPPNHTTKQSPIVAGTKRRNSRPKSHISHHARHTHHNHTHPTPAPPARLCSSGEPRSRPSGPARPSVPGRAPTGT